MAQDQSTPSDSVEVIIQGRQYKSIRAYKREQIKDTLKQALSSHNLMKFSDEELYEIMKEARQQQAADSLVKGKMESGGQALAESSLEEQIIRKGTSDLNLPQMQEMLDNYQEEHEGSDPLFLHPEKVKNVIIKSHEGTERASED